jgi:aldehyde:ferredoxin oxidoreductase
MPEGKVARVNLTDGTIEITGSEEYYRWLGGRGFGSRVILNEVEKETEPLSERNKLVFAAGIFSGTSLPGASRTELVTKNALNMGISYSSGGGNFAPQLKYAGFNALIIEGRSEKPVYLCLGDGEIEIRSADSLWGKTTWDTVDEIRRDLGDSCAEVASIGPAGENLVRVSCVIIDRAHALAWGGSGAIMGSKNLKAIAVRSGTYNIPISDPLRFEREVKRYKWLLKSSGASHALREGGTHGAAGVGGWSGIVPTSVENLQEEYWDPEKSKKINEKAYKAFEKGRVNCHNCPLYCLHEYEMEQEGEVLKCEGMHANSVRGFGSNWGVDNPFAVLKAHALCNMYGLDVDGVSSTIAWAVECFERGLISQKETMGLKLAWGDYKVLLQLVEDIACRKGFGDLLSGGVYEASQLIGNNTSDYAMHIKKIGINEQGLRSHKAWAFGMAVSLRGSGHLSGSPQTENRQITSHVGRWLFGVKDAGKPASYENKGRLVGWYEIYKALVDSLGMCYFTAGWYEVALADISNFVELYNAMLGSAITKKELWARGKNIINMEKAFNTVHAGFTREDDTLPKRIMNEPLTKGPFEGEFFDPDEFQKMLSDYYEYHGWDSVTGLQLVELLSSEGLEDVADYLTANGFG